ncbi:MAG: histidine kinase N-terminal 7TM domain-containing protein [Bacteroidales bacterium]|nr:histidine kinase N-terminal 7TM domain-containing protein [Bacteroidales bacterium]
MIWQITYITWIHFFTSIVSLQIVFIVYRMSQIRGRIPFLWMMALATFWSFLLVFESAAPTMEEKIVLSRFEYFANMLTPLFFVKFIFSYNLEKPNWVIRNFWILTIIPICTLILVFTNKYHQLIWSGFSWSPAGNNILIYHHGPFFYIAMSYSLLMIVFGNLQLISFITKRPSYYKPKAVFLISASLFPLFTGLIYTVGLSPVEGLDISPMGISLSGLIFYIGISREHLFDIVPAGHQLMIEKMNDGAIVLDKKNFIMDINPAAMKTFNIKEQIRGRKLEYALPLISEVINKDNNEGESVMEIDMEPLISIWVEIIINPLKDSRNKPLGSLLILHDITRRKQAELQLKKLADELTEMSVMKDQLYSIIGHDLRSPFNAILGFAGLLSESYDDYSNEERKQFANNILVASRSAYNLLENLLEWSKIQLGRTPFSPEELNLNLFVNEAFHLLRLSAQGKSIELINRVSPSQMILADKNMLSTILRNLVSNGIKFTPRGGRVEVFAEVYTEAIELIVSDNGIGMSNEMVDKLFKIDSLVTTPGTSNEKGTGLGLILCRDFIEKHKGTIRVQSEPGRGSQFFIKFPLNFPGIS